MIHPTISKPENYPHKIKSEWFSVGKTYASMIYDLMMSGMFKDVLEIGCAEGYSTYCFASALRDRGDFKFTACDVFFQRTVLDMAKHFPINLVKKRSVEVISPDFDFVFVDSEHDIKTVGEEIFMLLDCGTDTILAHDTFIKAENCKGAVLLRKVFSQHRDYFSINWHGRVEGDHTHYGMSLFTKRREVYDLALGLERLKPIIFSHKPI
jgi:hypothetical protein